MGDTPTPGLGGRAWGAAVVRHRDPMRQQPTFGTLVGMSRPTTIDEYIAGLAPPARERIAEMRALVNETAPELTEAVKWRSPAFLHASGVIMLVVSAHRMHANITFTPSTKEAFAAQLADFTTGKGSVQLPYDRPLPTELLQRMIRYRIAEHVDDGVMWM